MQFVAFVPCFLLALTVSCQVPGPGTAPKATEESVPAEPSEPASRADKIAAAGDQLVHAILDLHSILLDCQEPPTSAEQQVIQQRRAKALLAQSHIAALTAPIRQDLEALSASDSVPMPPGQAGLNAAIELLGGLQSVQGDAALFGEAGVIDQELQSLPLEKRQALHALDRAGELQVELKLIIQALSSLPAGPAGASAAAP
jgi:hypothetical protein